MQIRSLECAEKDELEQTRAPKWMLDAVALNPGYTCWGPHEDYMMDGGQWSRPIVHPTWADFGPWGLDELNEIVNFYFYIERDEKECAACGGSGYNPETRTIADGFYAHSSPTGIGWNDKITADELAALVEHGRVKPGTTDLETVNAENRPGARAMGHDAINRWILIETRAKRLGVWGHCPTCEGRGSLFTSDAARLGLVLWVLHPRKGCSQGVEIENVTEAEFPAAREYLRAAAKRNADRFGKL